MKALACFVGAVPDHDHPIEIHDLLLEAEQLIAERGQGHTRATSGTRLSLGSATTAPGRRDDANSQR
jgi:hypothetical protein